MESPGDLLSDTVLPTLFYPGHQASEAGGAGDIIYEEHSMDVPIVVLHHRLPKTLLSGRVPQLELVRGRGGVYERTKRDITTQPCKLFVMGTTERDRTWCEDEKEETRERGQEKKSCVTIAQNWQRHANRHRDKHRVITRGNKEHLKNKLLWLVYLTRWCNRAHKALTFNCHNYTVTSVISVLSLAGDTHLQHASGEVAWLKYKCSLTRFQRFSSSFVCS